MLTSIWAGPHTSIQAALMQRVTPASVRAAAAAAAVAVAAATGPMIQGVLACGRHAGGCGDHRGPRRVAATVARRGECDELILRHSL